MTAKKRCPNLKERKKERKKERYVTKTELKDYADSLHELQKRNGCQVGIIF